MLMLCSDGLTSGVVVESLRGYIAGARSAAVVVTADPVYKAANYHVPECVGALEGLGLRVDVLDIDVTPCGNLERYDVVEFIGGNPFYLLAAIRRVHAEPVLRRVAEKKVLIGWSAAAFVFGPSLGLVNRYSPEMNAVGLKDLTALGLTDVEVLPHYDRFLSRFERFEETCAEYEADSGGTVVRLNDGEAVVIDGIAVQVIRKAPSSRVREESGLPEKGL